MTPIDLDASSAAVLSWLLTYAIHSTILLAVAAAIAIWFADEHAWLDVVWKTALLGPLVTASVQVGSGAIPLGRTMADRNRGAGGQRAGHAARAAH